MRRARIGDRDRSACRRATSAGRRASAARGRAGSAPGPASHRRRHLEHDHRGAAPARRRATARAARSGRRRRASLINQASRSRSCGPKRAPLRDRRRDALSSAGSMTARQRRVVSARARSHHSTSAGSDQQAAPSGRRKWNAAKCRSWRRLRAAGFGQRTTGSACTSIENSASASSGTQKRSGRGWKLTVSTLRVSIWSSRR